MSSLACLGHDRSGPAACIPDVDEALDALQRALKDSPTESADRLVHAIHDAVQALLALPRGQPSPAVTARVVELSRALRAARAFELLPLVDLAQLAPEARGWQAVLPRLLLGSAWHHETTPLLGSVPDAFWGEYAEWLFAPPESFKSAADADRFAAHSARHLEELNRWGRRNAGSAALRAAAESYLRVAALLPLVGGQSSTRRLLALRGEFLTRHYSGTRKFRGKAPAPRIGRRLRIGFVAPRFGPAADLRAIFPVYAQLDVRSFETILFSLAADEIELAKERAGKVPEMAVLPPELGDQVAALRNLALDVLVFCGDLGRRLDGVTKLACHRLAALQIAGLGSGLGTTGLPEIDLYVRGGEVGAPEVAHDFSERLGLLRGPALSFELPTGGANNMAQDPRAALGLPADATLFATVVTATGASPASLTNWAQVLAANPGSRLLIARLSDELERDSGAQVAALGEALERVCRQQQVPTERISIFPVAVGGLAEVRTLLSLADVYLHADADSDLIWVAESLVLGRPTIATTKDAVDRRTAAGELLAAVEAAELLASSSESFVQLAGKLGASATSRAEYGQRIKAAVEAGPGFLDSLAASDAFAALLETAFDELAALGPEQFRSQREPLRCFAPDDVAETVAAGEAALASGDSYAAATEAGLALRANPLDVSARILRGRVLLTEGDAARASVYLLAAVGRRSDDPELWFFLANAFWQTQRIAEAIQALEASLRLDGSRVEAWFLLREIAEAGGVAEMAQDALNVLRELAPDDPRVLAMA